MTAAGNMIGPFLRSLRVSRRLSLRQLAEQASVSRRTLLYWESGTYQPSLPELQAVLRALHASPEERLCSLALLDAPRAHAVGRRVLTAPLNAPERAKDLGNLPSGGDLLRSLRSRRGLLLEQVAARMRVAPSTVSRWESSQTAPPDDRLRELLHELGANEAETDALGEGYLFLQAPLREKVASPEELRESFRAFADALYSQREDPLNDLRFLSFEAQAWRLAAQSKGEINEIGERILADVRADYASYLSGFDRFAEAERYANHVLAAGTNLRSPLPESSQVRAAITAARAGVYRARRTRDALSAEDTEGPILDAPNSAALPPTCPERGLAMLQKWQTLALSPNFHAWLLSDMAEYLSLQENWDAAVRLRREACEIAAQCANPDELRLRQLDLAKLEVRIGAADTALTRVQLKPTDTPFRRADIELFCAEASLALGEPDAAREWFERGRADVETHRLLHLRRRARSIAARLAH